MQKRSKAPGKSPGALLHREAIVALLGRTWSVSENRPYVNFGVLDNFLSASSFDAVATKITESTPPQGDGFDDLP
ncbi:hypothetical protein E1J17_00615 [Kocuria rosea]|nr:hypothetical protein [Kocuria rosea]THE19492.1 hypothetical protein E1J17_00615 [Kocuria rosea]